MSQVVKSWPSGVLFKTLCLFLCCYSGTLSFPSLSKDLDKWWWGRSLTWASRRCLCLTRCVFSCSETNLCRFWCQAPLFKLTEDVNMQRVSHCRGIHCVEGIGFACQNLSARAGNSRVLHCSPLPTTSEWKSGGTSAAVAVLSKTSFFWGFFVDQFMDAFLYLQDVLKNASTLFSRVTCFMIYFKWVLLAGFSSLGALQLLLIWKHGLVHLYSVYVALLHVL